MYRVDILDSDVQQDRSGLNGPIDDLHLGVGVDVVVRRDEGGAGPLVALVLTVREEITDEGGGDAGPVITTEVAGLLHVRVEVQSSVAHLLPWIPLVSADRAREIPAVKSEWQTDCTLIEGVNVGVGHYISQVEDLDNAPPVGFPIKNNFGIYISSNILNIMHDIVSVNIDMGTDSLEMK